MRRPFLFSLLATLSLAACAAPASDASTDDSDITDVKHTPVKEQTIGNCWLYASVAWAESLHQIAVGETRDLSESYLTYWHWYEQINGFRNNPGGEPKLQTGGFFHVATHLMKTYGLMNEASFIPTEESSVASQKQRSALAKIEAALKPGGALATQDQRSPKNIRTVLNDAFELPADVRADLDAAFGADEPTPLARDRSVPERIIAPWTFDAASKASPGATVVKKPIDVVGDEWEESYLWGAEADKRAPLRRLQKAMHDGLPALIVWNVDWASSGRDGTFRKLPVSKLDKWDGAHMTVVEDYQAISVPGHGTVPVGIPVTDPTVFDALLADQTRIGLVRIKNSWGFRENPTTQQDFKGYYDLHNDYLFEMKALTSVIVPRGFDDRAPAGQTDVCATGGRARSGTYCASGITSDANDARLLTCTNGVSTTVRDCEAGCKAMPEGTPDQCSDPPPANPCATGASSGPGKYCGASLGRPTDSRLYSCQRDPATNTMISPFVECANGCKVQPPGVPDRCN
jgi:hypothetical protein